MSSSPGEPYESSSLSSRISMVLFGTRTLCDDKVLRDKKHAAAECVCLCGQLDEARARGSVGANTHGLHKDKKGMMGTLCPGL